MNRSIYLDEKVDNSNLKEISKMLEANLIQKDNTTASERERVARERKIAATSLYYPPASQQLPHPFLLQAGNLQVPSLGQKISNLSGIEGIDRVAQASSQAFPAADIAGSIYDIASQPVEVPIAKFIEETQTSLEAMRARVIENAELTGSSEEMAELADMPVEELVQLATPFPNLAREIMRLGLGMETFQTAKLAAYKKQGDEFKEKINLLLSLSSHLPKLSAEDTPSELKLETKEAIMKIHEELKAKGIDIFPGMTIGDEFSKEQLAAANSLVNHHIDVSRSSLQELFTTKISLAIQFLSMMGEVMKKVSEKDDQLKRKANQLQH